MNNKGFAITTILYGTFLLFMMLLLIMLGILSRYKENLSILIDETNGARDIVDVYDKDSYLMQIVKPNLTYNRYYKAYDGIAIICSYVQDNYSGYSTGPLLISTNRDAVAYYINDEKDKIFTSTGSVTHNGVTYYYSSLDAFVDGDRYVDSPYNWSEVTGLDGYIDQTVKEVLSVKIK